MIYDLQNEYDRSKFKAKVNQLYTEKALVELKRKTTNRSLAQNSYLHVLLCYFASEFGYTMEEVKHDIFKKKCNPELFLHKRKNKRGFEVTYVRSSTELDKAEMTLAIERFRNYSSAVCGLYLPEPNEHRALVYAQQQIEQYKNYV
ncbi:hypothetical protein [Sodaliphilus pleomorphus]|uniref:Uncharacterized protein n=1 Tax=Sodaliphilus pleomorphus TaxID=2606626 RepID=A0A6L5XDV6_9BACT|nr:hypothetical protein [Sodaliphilus pleomorphus]MSS16842.1 hypothetical protein [Sodaliphilus pleomorphus]